MKSHRSASATAAYVKKQVPSGSKVYFVGEAGLGKELEDQGFEALGLHDGSKKDVPNPFTVDHDIRAVIVGLDR